jgi:tRNA(fMet)-specific endonuclease VapC
MYLLDTGPCIEVLRDKRSKVRKRLKQHDPSEIVLCSIVKAELLYGARKSEHISKNQALVKEFCAPFVSLPFDDRCVDQYAMIRADLERTGMRIGANDLFVAAIAKSYDLILVTSNIGEFSRIAALQIEDWHL